MKTKYFSKLLFAATVLLTLGSCAADDFEGQNPSPSGNGQTLAIEVSTGSEMAGTRATYTTSNGVAKESFVEGDEIGVYGMNGTEVFANNVKFTLNAEGHWVPEADVTYSYEYTYYAYYPYRASGTLSGNSCTFDGSVAPAEETDDSSDKFAAFISHWPIATDQSNVANFEASDLLAARGVNQAIPIVKFTMAHKLAMIELVPPYNYWFYKQYANSDLTTAARQTMGVDFTGNIPYELDGNFYYICRPNTNTTVGGQTLQAASGKFYYKRLETITGSYTLQYDSDLDGDFDDGKPSWMNISEKEGEAYKTLLVSFNASSSTSVGTTLPSGTVSNYDLSMYDVTGNTCSQTTANSYMVHKGGTYKLPLVYGNAIKNGATNTAAFMPSGSSDVTFLTPFKSALNNDIDDPWIKNVDGPVSSAELVWQDASGMITAVSIDGDYLKFTVADGAPCGNAMIAVKNSGGTILWSWHIWACPDWYKTASLTPIKSGDITYQVCPVNLGWVGPFTKNTYTVSSCRVKMVPASGTPLVFTVDLPQTDEYVPTSYGYCPYYQWGRKDPEVPSVGNANTGRAVYNISNTSFANGTAPNQTHSSSAVNIATTIQHPNIHYYNSANYGPYNTNQYNLWDATESIVTASGNKTGYTVKTIYDPCPPGYCVPRGNLYYTITNGGSMYDFATWNSPAGTYMRTWQRCFPAINFPAAGNRNNSSGTTLYHVASSGYCWASSAYSETSARDLSLSSERFYWDDSSRARGFTVRPVRER